tara:strand:+ start:2885 stop:3460 length:576 start_codon:yes stop_codon:yes gene_type:complete
LENLKLVWDSKEQQHVVAFYGEKNSFGEFSNFYRISHTFTIPEWCGVKASISIPVEFSEKSIMLCKASLFHDSETFEKIRLAKTPFEAKKLGRTVKKFNEKKWLECVCDIAVEVVYQKFKSNKTICDVLLSTQTSLIAEAAPYDKLWGIGLNVADTRTSNPKKWEGYNVLGFALMKAREKLFSNRVGESYE